MDYKNINDYEQLYLICENDEEAKNIIFKKYQPIIISIAKKYFQNYNTKKIFLDDLIEEGYIGLSNAIKAFNENEDTLFYTFCSICIERQIRSYCRNNTSLKHNILNDAFSIEYYNEMNENGLEFQIESRDLLTNPNLYINEKSLYERLINFKHNLPENQSFVFELRYNGFKYKEIAKLLDLSIHSVDNYIHIVKKKLFTYFSV